MASEPLRIERLEYGSPEYDQMVELRYRVLREPLGLQFPPEELARDASDVLLGGWLADQLAACLILTRLSPGEMKMRQVAVGSGYQGLGFGRQVVEASETIARLEGAEAMTLHARENAVPFYLRLGYEIEGEPFEEVGIPHRRMLKRI